MVKQDKGGDMKLRLAIDGFLAVTALAILSSQRQTLVSITLLGCLLGYLVLESRIVVMDMEEWE